MALATATATFGLGMLILPPLEPVDAPVAAPAPPPPPPPVAPPPPPPPPPPVDAIPSATDAAPPAPEPAPAKPASEVAPAPPPEPAAAPKPAVAVSPPAAVKPEAPPSDKPDAPPAVEAPAGHAKLADKDLAREAWRKNLPDISAEPGKSTMLIPIRGSIEGAVFHVTTKPRSVLITLPKAESMITMEFYGPKRDGFRQLWIKKEDSGTTMRVVLGDATDPQVEIKEEFVRVTVRRPVETSSAAPAGTAPTGAAAASPAAAPAAAPTPAATDAASKPPAQD